MSEDTFFAQIIHSPSRTLEAASGVSASIDLASVSAFVLQHSFSYNITNIQVYTCGNFFKRKKRMISNEVTPRMNSFFFHLNFPVTSTYNASNVWS